MDFRQRLLATRRAVQPVLRVPGVLVIGSELPNLWEPGLASSLVVSEDPRAQRDRVYELLALVEETDARLGGGS